MLTRADEEITCNFSIRLRYSRPFAQSSVSRPKTPLGRARPRLIRQAPRLATARYR